MIKAKNSQLRPRKVKNDPKIRSSKVSIEVTKENKSCSTTWVDPKRVFEPYPDPKDSPLGPQKVKDYAKIKSKIKVRIKRTIENKSCSTAWVDSKTVFEPYSDPKKNSPLGS